jgi:hypothetical protein
MIAVSTYLKLLWRAPRVLRAINRSPELFGRLIDRHFAADSAGPGLARALTALPGVVPLNLRIDSAVQATPTLNVLIPALTLAGMSGGPNTALQIAVRMAAAGISVRLVSIDAAAAPESALRAHIASLTGLALPTNLSIACHADRTKPLAIGVDDVFFATAWWSAQMVKKALPLTGPKRFLYQIAEFEPALYPASSEFALALETYALDFHALICESLIGDYLRDQRIGRFAEPGFIERCAVFEPAVDRTRFHPEPHPCDPRRLLFYCRPTKARRNLSELGLHALRRAVDDGVFDRAPWEMLFIGEDLPALELGKGHVIRAAPWLGYDDYAALLRRSDVLLSLMLSPHTSYPPLEFAACGGIAVHNTYATKTAARLAALSPNIVAVEPTVDGIVAGLRAAVASLEQPRAADAIRLPSSWSEALRDVVPKAVGMFHDCLATAVR